MKKYFLPLVCLLTLIGAAPAAPYTGQQATVELIADVSEIVPGETFYLGLRYELESHWHVYWKNPGASGLAPEVEWDLPEGFEVGAMEFPAPERFELGGLVSYAHEGAPLFLVPVKAPFDLSAGDTVSFQASVFWLICKDVCIADDAKLELILPVGDGMLPDENAALFAAAQSAQPLADFGVEMTTRQGESSLVEMTIRGLDSIEDSEEVYFYAEAEGVIDPNAEQTRLFDPFRLQVSLDKTYSGDLPVTIPGVLQVGDAYFVIGSATASTSAQPSETGASGTSIAAETKGFEQRLLDFGIVGWLILAFIGGFILNIMPCVLPVLSLKVFSLLKHTGQSRGQAVLHGLAYTLGVVASFVALAAVLFALRAAGQWIGWGYQLQSPGFTLGLAVLFFVFGLNLLGVFEIGAGLVGADAKISQRNDLLGSFGMGILAAVVGAPCMGPLVASVSGLAIQAPVGLGLLVFGVMGLGLASPFLFLAIFPKLVSKLPKPGLWMETFKQIMGFLLMLAVIFLASVIGSAGGASGMVSLLLVLFICALAGWIYGRWGALSRPKPTRRKALLLTAFLIVGSFIYGVGQIEQAYTESAGGEKTDGPWATWSPQRVEAELAAGRSVFVDFTASWCLICQANKIPLRSAETEALFAQYDIVLLEADWTLRDSVIARVLEENGRAGVPLYLLIQPDGTTTQLPQNLTRGIIESAVKKAFDES
jgi:thiol:disulfide interchange protein DsbD